MTIPEMFDFHLVNSPTHPVFVYRDVHDGQVRTMTWRGAARAVHRVAQDIGSLFKDRVNEDSKVIAVLATADFITYSLFGQGIMRAGYTVFPISTRNSPEIIAHLLNLTKPTHLFVTGDPAMQALAAAGTKNLRFSGMRLMDMPSFEALFPQDDPEPVLSAVALSSKEPGMIIHSSGSTAFPKPIYIKHRTSVYFAKAHYWGEMDICGEVQAAHSVPFFHISGAAQVWWAATTGVIISTFGPANPPVVPTPDAVLDGILATKSTLVYGVSPHIEAWSNDLSKINALTSLKALIFQGAPLEKNTGKRLRAAGVPLIATYGSTECGIVSRLIPPQTGEDPDWFYMSPHCSPVFLPHSEPGVFELVLLQTDRHPLNAVNTEIDGKDAYATSDLLIRHPDRPDLYRVYGRADDQIVLSTGEKTNPVPLESLITKDAAIASAVLFGRGKFNIGVLIEPTEPFDPEDKMTLDTFRDSIWPTIEQVNAFAPTHSRLFKEMILVTKPSKPFEYTAKGTPRRNAVLAAYRAEIGGAYSSLESAPLDTALAPNASLADTENFVKETVTRILRRDLKDTDDLFAYGCDSLQATWIRNSISRALGSVARVEPSQLSSNVIYEHPSIAALASFVHSQITEAQDTVLAGRLTGDAALRSMQEMIARYSSNLKPRLLIPRRGAKEYILLTGTTGALGSFILESLLSDERVDRVYCINRHSPAASVLQRQTAAFADRGIDETLLRNEKCVLLEADTSRGDLGLSADILGEICGTVTHIIHNAWPVHFMFTLASFQSAFEGLRNLIDLYLSSPTARRFVYISSISVANNWRRDTPVPETPLHDLSLSLGFGYGMSKLVAEHVLGHAQGAGLAFTAVRVGQLTGGPNGAWSTKEWFPTLAHSARVLGCLPETVGAHTVEWLPVHTAAAAICELRDAPATHLHVVHPKSVGSGAILAPLGQALGVPLVPYAQWLAALEASDGESNPALNLLPFYRSLLSARAAEDGTAGSGESVLYSTSEARALSSTLASPDLQPVGEGDVGRWVDYWRRRDYVQ